MAITHSLKFSEGFTPNANNWTSTNTLTSVANRLYVVGASWSGTTLRSFTSLVHNAGTNPLTFVKMSDVTSNTVASPVQRTVNCRALKGSASNAGTLTLTISGTASRMAMIVSEFDGVDTTGTDGSGAVLQTTLSNNGDAAATLNLTFASLGNSNNRMWAFGAGDVSGATWTPDGNYAEIADQATGEVLTVEAQWDNGSGDLTCTFDASSNADMGLVGVEIVAGSTTTTVTPSAATAAFAVNAPTVVKGGVIKTPSAVTAAWSVVAPTLLKTYVATPTPVTAVWAVNTPNILKGAVNLTPSAAVAVFSVPAPTIPSGEQTMTPSAIQAAFAVNTPSMLIGGLVLTPSAVTAVLSVATPSLIKGGVVLTPDPIAAAWSMNAPLVVRGPIILTPAASQAIFGVNAPTIVKGPVTLLPSPVGGQFVVMQPTVDGGAPPVGGATGKVVLAIHFTHITLVS